MVLRLVYAWIVNVVALAAAAYLVDGVDYDEDYWVLVVAGLVFALVNLVLKPVVKWLALPIVVLTLGLALFFVNLLMLYVTTWIVPGFDLESFRAGLWATVVVTAVNWVLSVLLGRD